MLTFYDMLIARTSSSSTLPSTPSAKSLNFPAYVRTKLRMRFSRWSLLLLLACPADALAAIDYSAGQRSDPEGALACVCAIRFDDGAAFSDSSAECCAGPSSSLLAPRPVPLRASPHSFDAEDDSASPRLSWPPRHATERAAWCARRVLRMHGRCFASSCHRKRRE